MPIRVKVNVCLLDKRHFFHGKQKADGSKPIYVDLVLFETPGDQYGNDYRVSQDLPREARDAGEKGAIVGNGKVFGAKAAAKPSSPPPQQRKPPVDPDLDAARDDLPF